MGKKETTALAAARGKELAGRGWAAWPFALYNVALALLFPFLLVYFVCGVARGRIRPGLLQRLGFLPEMTSEGRPRLWLHAVSVGEVSAAVPVLRRVWVSDDRISLFVSTTTETGNRVARQRLADVARAILYAPLDFPFCVRMALQAVEPAALVLVETELWPNLICEARRLGVRVGVVNGKISDRTRGAATLVQPLYRAMLRLVEWLCVQSESDAKRTEELGAAREKVTVVGNTKFDEVEREIEPAQRERLMHELGLKEGQFVLVAGSTNPGEEESVLRAHWEIRVRHPDARLIVVPRQLSRVPQIEELVVRQGFPCARLTALREGTAAAGGGADPVVLVDTMGELAALYSVCTVAFVGGSLIRKGGHNILQPLAAGKPVLFGPFMHKQRTLATMALGAGVGFQVGDAHSLAAKAIDLYDSGEATALRERALTFIAGHRGASDACAEAALSLARGETGAAGV